MTLHSAVQFTLSPDNEYGNVAVGEDFGCLAAQHQAPKPPATMRCHHNEIALLILSGGDDGFGNLRIGDMQRFHGYALPLGDLPGARKNCV